MKLITTQHEFGEWVRSAPERIGALLVILPDSVKQQMDYSLNSLDVLGEWLVETYPRSEHISQDSRPIGEWIMTYVGETFLRQAGGQWVIELNDEDMAYRGIPGVQSDQAANIYPSYPGLWVGAAVFWNVKGLIRGFAEQKMTGKPYKRVRTYRDDEEEQKSNEAYKKFRQEINTMDKKDRPD
jgi:hypothetical protein